MAHAFLLSHQGRCPTQSSLTKSALCCWTLFCTALFNCFTLKSAQQRESVEQVLSLFYIRISCRPPVTTASNPPRMSTAPGKRLFSELLKTTISILPLASYQQLQCCKSCWLRCFSHIWTARLPVMKMLEAKVEFCNLIMVAFALGGIRGRQMQL